MGILQKKCRTTRKKALAYRGKGGQKYRYCFSCLKVRGGSLQGALKGTNLRGQTEPKRRFSLIFADSRLFLETKHLGNADFRRNPLIFAENRRKSQEPAENRRLAFVPLGSSP